MATALSAMSTTKADSRPRVRFFIQPSGTARRLRAEGLLEAQCVHMIVIVVMMPTEQPVTRFFITRNRPGVVRVDFKTHGPAMPPPRFVLGGRKEERPDTAAADMRSDSDGIKPGDAGARRKKHQSIACKFAARLGHD